MADEEEEPTQSFAQPPPADDGGLAALRAEVDKLYEYIGAEADKLSERVDKIVREAIEKGRADRHDGITEQHNTEKLRLDVDELFRRIRGNVEGEGERRRVLMTHLGTTSTWSELISVGASLTTGGSRNSPPLHALSKRDGSYPLLEMPDSTYGTAYYLIDRTATVEVTGACVKPGTYTAKFRKSFSGFDSTDPTPLDVGDFGEEGDDCIVINGAERTRTGHDLIDDGNISNPFPGHIIGRDDATLLPLVLINGYDADSCDEAGDSLIV